MRTVAEVTAILVGGALLVAVHDAPAAQQGQDLPRLAQADGDNGGMLRRREEPVVPEAAPDEPVPDEPEAIDEAVDDAEPTMAVPAVPETEKHYEPEMDSRVRPAEVDEDGFRPDPAYEDHVYSVAEQIEIYGGKRAIDAPRPLIELGYPMYAHGSIGPGYDIIGRKNLVRPQFLLYGDWITAVGHNVIDDDNEFGQAATQLNLNANLDLTATERIHALFRPLEDKGELTRHEFNRTVDGESLDNVTETEFSPKPITFYFEGDAGRIWAGLRDEHNSVDLPFAIGRIPLFVQNGIWLDDAFDGAAVAIPAINSPRYDISNADVAFYFGFNNISTDGIPDSEDNAALLAIATFIERREAYYEIDYGFVEDRTGGDVDRSYHTVALAWTRRFGATLSHSTRIIGNFGQDEDDDGNNTADGVLLLLENSLITSKPYTLVPYFNLFYGDGTPQPLARTAGGMLQNTGINFEEDALTGFQSLDFTGHNAFGGAVGIQNLFDLNRQLVVEVAGLTRHGDFSDQGDEYALGARFQQPFARRWIFRTDGVVGVKEEAGGPGTDDADFNSVRAELRMKF